MKKTFAILTLALALTMTAQAQIFIEEGDANVNRSTTEDFGVIPFHGATIDQADYVPMGGGMLIMTALGVCYLMNKKNKPNRVNYD